MSSTALQALNAYAQAVKSGKATGGADAAPDATKAQGTQFADMVKDAIGNAATSTQHAEKMTMAGATGKAEMVDVVTAISQAEVQLETVIAVRDEMIKAYQDIMRMPI